MRLGRLPADPAALARAPSLAAHRFAALAPPAAIDRGAVPFAPGLYENDTLPDCTAAGLANAAGMVAALNGFSLAIDPARVPAFYAGCVGCAPTDAAMAATDGAVMLDVLTRQAVEGFDVGPQLLAGLFGTLPLRSGTVDATISQELAAEFPAHVASLGLTTPTGTVITADTYPQYMLTTFLEPAAATYLAALSDADRTSYLSTNPWITWASGQATFTWADFLAHLGTRSKSAPAFDAFDLSTAENTEFGDATTNVRHFTDYSLRKATGDASATVGADLQATVDMISATPALSSAPSSVVPSVVISV